MSILDTAIGIIAPHYCLGCGAEGSILCTSCRVSELVAPPSRCAFCQSATKEYKTCAKCRRNNPVGHVWVCSEYEPLARKVVAAYKFGAKRAAAVEIVETMAETLPASNTEWLIVPTPTITSHVRKRGFDHTHLLAKRLGLSTQLPVANILRRTDQRTQVGGKRTDRLAKIADSLRITDPAKVFGRRILLVDDVITTGATISSAAQLLKASGAKSVDALIFA